MNKEENKIEDNKIENNTEIKNEEVLNNENNEIVIESIEEDNVIKLDTDNISEKEYIEQGVMSESEVELFISTTANYVIANPDKFNTHEALDDYYNSRYSEISKSVLMLFDEFKERCNSKCNEIYNSFKNTQIEKVSSNNKPEKTKKKGIVGKTKDFFSGSFNEAKSFIMEEAMEIVVPQLKSFIPKIEKEIKSYLKGEQENGERILIAKLEKNGDVSVSIFKIKNIDINMKSLQVDEDGNVKDGVTQDDIDKELKDAFEGKYTLSEGIDLFTKAADMSKVDMKKMMDKLK